ncbi:MAG: 4'-phosphopantetheinyl transferase superfamily protein [Hespellia sp.]|nr:4'-phosphopantetheinyl transferase superfamily protein [Hespellia sp.]
MVATWIADVSPLMDSARYERLRSLAPLWRRNKADRIRFADGRALSIGAWTLWEKMKKEYALNDQAVFNLSHSGSYVMCSCETEKVSEAKVGCDIQKIEKLRLNLAKRFFCENEYHSILSIEDEDEQRDLFYRYWVLKESFAKATRQGLKIGLDRFEIGLSPDCNPVLLCQPKEIREQYYYKEYKVDGLPYKLAVCATDNEFAGKLSVFSLIR